MTLSGFGPVNSGAVGSDLLGSAVVALGRIVFELALNFLGQEGALSGAKARQPLLVPFLG